MSAWPRSWNVGTGTVSQRFLGTPGSMPLSPSCQACGRCSSLPTARAIRRPELPHVRGQSQPWGLPAGTSEEPPEAHPESHGPAGAPRITRLGPRWAHPSGSQVGSPVWTLGRISDLSASWVGSPIWVPSGVTRLGPGGVTCLGPGWAHLSGSQGGHLSGPLQCDSSVSCPIAKSSPS